MSLHGDYGCSWTSFCLLESLSFSKMPANLIQYRGAVRSFNNRHSAHEYIVICLCEVFVTIIFFQIAFFPQQSLHKICENTGFQWPVFSRIRTKSVILSLYGRIQVAENLYFCIFYAVSGFSFVLLLTVFLITKHNTCNGTNNIKALPFSVATTKILIATWLYRVLLYLGGDVELNLGLKQSN